MQCLKKVNYTNEIYPCTNIRLSTASGSKITPAGQVSVNVNVGELKLKHTFIVPENLTRPLILGLDFHH